MKKKKNRKNKKEKCNYYLKASAITYMISKTLATPEIGSKKEIEILNKLNEAINISVTATKDPNTLNGSLLSFLLLNIPRVPISLNTNKDTTIVTPAIASFVRSITPKPANIVASNGRITARYKYGTLLASIFNNFFAIIFYTSFLLLCIES